MPIVKVSTNFGANQLPENFMPEFAKQLADILGKPHGRMNWKLETDQSMSLLGPSNHRDPFMMVEISSFDIFDDEDKCRGYVKPIFDYLTSKTDLTKDQVLTLFNPIKRHHIGVKGACPQ